MFVVYHLLSKCFGRYCDHLQCQNPLDPYTNVDMDACLCKFIVLNK